MLRSLRVHQWTKNALVFIPLVLGGQAANLDAWSAALLGFISLSLTCSATYLINDLADLKSDRAHPTKRFRPLARREITPSAAIAMAVVGLSVGFYLAMLLGTGAVALLAAYLALTLCYTFFLKRVPIVDITVIAALFTCRLAFGIAIAGVLLSPWLLVFSMFSFLSLCLAKRNTEALLSGIAFDVLPGRGYMRTDAPLLLSLGLAASLSATMILILYLIEDAFPRGFYAHPQWLWALPVILFLFFGRIWLVSQRSELSDDPVEFALKDPTCLIYGAVGLLTLFLAIV